MSDGREAGDRFQPRTHRRENVPGTWYGYGSGPCPGPCREETPSVRGGVPGSPAERQGTGRQSTPNKGKGYGESRGGKESLGGDQRLGFFRKDLGPPRCGFKPQSLWVQRARGARLWARASGGRKLGRREKWMCAMALVLKVSGIVRPSTCQRLLRARPGAHCAAVAAPGRPAPRPQTPAEIAATVAPTGPQSAE